MVYPSITHISFLLHVLQTAMGWNCVIGRRVKGRIKGNSDRRKKSMDFRTLEDGSVEEQKEEVHGL